MLGEGGRTVEGPDHSKTASDGPVQAAILNLLNPYYMELQPHSVIIVALIVCSCTCTSIHEEVIAHGKVVVEHVPKLNPVNPVHPVCG